MQKMQCIYALYILHGFFFHVCVYCLAAQVLFLLFAREGNVICVVLCYVSKIPVFSVFDLTYLK